MCKFYDFLRSRKRTDPSGAILRITGDRRLPIMDALLELYVNEPEKLDGLIEVIPEDNAPLRILELRQFRPPYMKALDDISQFLQNNGYEDASKFLDCGLEL